MSDGMKRTSGATRRAKRSTTLSRSILGTIVLSLSVAVACNGDDEFVCQRQLVNVARTTITPFADLKVKAKNAAAAEKSCLNTTAVGAAVGLSPECSCSPANVPTLSRVAPTAPIAP